MPNDDSIDALIDQYGEHVVRQAFALQQHIKEHGIEGVHFIKTARMKTQARAHAVTYQKLRENIPRRP